MSQFWFVLTIGWLFCNNHIHNNPSKISQYEIVTCSVTRITGAHMWQNRCHRWSKRCHLWHQFCHMCSPVTWVTKHVMSLHLIYWRFFFNVDTFLFHFGTVQQIWSTADCFYNILTLDKELCKGSKLVAINTKIANQNEALQHWHLTLPTCLRAGP